MHYVHHAALCFMFVNFMQYCINCLTYTEASEALMLTLLCLLPVFTETVYITLLGNLQCLLPNPNVLVAVTKGMRAVKLCTNKILQFLTGGAG